VGDRAQALGWKTGERVFRILLKLLQSRLLLERVAPMLLRRHLLFGSALTSLFKHETASADLILITARSSHLSGRLIAICAASVG
jgi:hypothetical protein